MLVKIVWKAVLTTGGSCWAIGAAYAQEPRDNLASAEAIAATPRDGDIVVTATRQAERLSRIPLSVSAVTQETLDRQNIRNIQDLARVVPALTFRESGVGGGAGAVGSVISLRGIYSASGSATVGVYLDDVPLQKRINNGVVGNGSPIPQLFDLQRVEVLRGPQGTLFGGSSQGGAIRFITPAPSLTDLSVYARAEASVTKGGDQSGEIGAAIGGPIVEGKLGYRVSAVAGRQGGWIDRYNPFTAQFVDDDINSVKRFAVRAALLWQATDAFSATPSVYISRSDRRDFDNYWENTPAYTLPSQSFNALGMPTTNPAQILFTRPPLFYPATTVFGQGRTGEPINSPRRDKLEVYSLALDYEGGDFIARSITSYAVDDTRGRAYVSNNISALHGSLFSGFSILTPNHLSDFRFDNHRKQFTQELRLSSAPGGRLNWVVGAFYSDIRNPSSVIGVENQDELTRSLRGVSSLVFYGVDEVANGFTASSRVQRIDESSLALFGEATYEIAPGLKLTAGARQSREKTAYSVCQFGTNLRVSTCTAATGTLAEGKTKETPFTPKGGVSYQLTPRSMIYATVGTGFRTGGINSAVPQNPGCQAALALIGGSRPATFDSDSVVSYEGGAKLGFGSAQINLSAFRIDWSDIQLNVALPGCQFSYVANAGKARSEGFDVTALLQLGTRVRADINVAHTSARYTQSTLGPDPVGPALPATIVNAGDRFPVAPWTVALGLEYRFPLFGDGGYVRGDYQFSSEYKRTVGPGAVGYLPDVYRADATQIVNARAGYMMEGVEAAVFVKNLLNSDDILTSDGGRSGCTTPSCAAFTNNNLLFRRSTFRPRELGLSLTYRY